MASIQKRGNKWIAEVRTKGKYRSKSFLMKAEAKEWAYEQEIRLGKSAGTVTGKTLADAMARYGKEISVKKKGARWEEVRLKKIGRDEISKIPLASLNSSDFDEWKARQTKLGPSSINRELTLLSSVLSHARRWKWIDSAPLADVDRPKDPPHRDRIISNDETSRILEALFYKGEVTTQRHRIAVAFLLALETCMRQGEIFNMHWEHINWKQCYVLLPDTKNGEARDVPLSNKAIALLKSLGQETGRVFKFPQASASTIFRRAVELAELKGIHFHDARHTAITRLVMTRKKIDPLTLAKIVGHKDPRNLMIYFNPTPKALADILNEA